MASEETGAKGSCSVSPLVLSSKKGVLKKNFLVKVQVHSPNNMAAFTEHLSAAALI